MDVNKNSYTFGFAGIMVVAVATLLSIAAINLKPFQNKNIELEKKQNILNTLGITVERDSAAQPYEKYITKSYLVNSSGEIVDGDAFDVDLAKELSKDVDDRSLPVFESQRQGVKSYILPLRGTGLWGPIWGYIALEEDLNTVLGAVFDHKAETPGLGAEINLPKFQEPFKGKNIFKGTEFVSIEVKKGGAEPNNMYQVDGISGGTITADGVTDMLKDRLGYYVPFFNSKRTDIEVESVLNSLANESLTIDTSKVIQ